MIDHFGIPVADIDAAARFYDEVLAVLGHRRMIDHTVAIGYGSDHPRFWIASRPADATGAPFESHLAFVAADAEQVRRFHATAVAAGAESLHDPRLWPEYHPAYYGAFVRDPDGNNVEAVFHGGDGAGGGGPGGEGH